jgi:hypothetical protein
MLTRASTAVPCNGSDRGHMCEVEPTLLCSINSCKCQKLDIQTTASTKSQRTVTARHAAATLPTCQYPHPAGKTAKRARSLHISALHVTAKHVDHGALCRPSGHLGASRGSATLHIQILRQAHT